ACAAVRGGVLQRGLVEAPVVSLGGEFGRTPRVGQRGFSGAGASADGRDHYPNCFCGILAGGRTRAGIVHGVSDSRAAFPNRDPVTPDDLAAPLSPAMRPDPPAPVAAPD